MSNKKRQDIVVVIDFPFPFGIAATNRILTYTKVLTQDNLNVAVNITRPTEKNGEILNFERQGVYDGVSYVYCSKSTIQPSNKIYKRFLLLKGYCILFKLILAQRPKVMITYTSNFFVKQILLLIRTLINNKLFFEETEYPKILARSKIKFIKYIYLRQYSKADGMIIMTNELKNYYQKIGVKKIFHLPMTVDSSRFCNNIVKSSTDNYFIYVGGDGGFKRDGLLNIIKGFCVAAKFNDTLKLYIVGDFNQSQENYIQAKSIISSKNMETKVIFLGKKPPIEIPNLLQASKGVIMTPLVDFPSGGFPTKLGEFLSSGRPVICTRVSEIPNYLNEKNSILIKPNDINEIKEAIEWVINNPNDAELIGKNGRILSETAFNFSTYLENFKLFINEK